MGFWGGWSIFGVYFFNIIGALWIDIYIGLFLIIVGLLFGINPLELFTAAYEGIPSLRRALFYKIVGLLANIVIGIVYYGGFKRKVAYKDQFNMATTDDITVGLTEEENFQKSKVLITF